MQTLDVIVLGGAAVDWVAEVDALPRQDGIALARSYARYPGGSAANVAVGTARLGYRTGFIGKLGDDEDGRWLLRCFAEEGVDTQAVVIERNRATGSCFIAVDQQGERIIIGLPGATILESAQELRLSYLERCRALYIGPAYLEIATEAMNAVHQRSGIVIYAPSGAWGSGGLEDIASAVREADVLLVSRAEAEALTGLRSPLSAAQRLRQVGPQVVIETLGREGALVLAGDRIAEAPAFPVANVRDTTGAGDAFAAGLIAGFLDGHDWPTAARIGCAVASLKIRHLGARSGLPTREEVTRLLMESAP